MENHSSLVVAFPSNIPASTESPGKVRCKLPEETAVLKQLNDIQYTGEKVGFGDNIFSRISNASAK